MVTSKPKGAAQRSAWFSHSERLSRVERIAVLTLVGVTAAYDLIGVITSEGHSSLDHLFSAFTSLALALYVWSPTAATAVLGILGATSLATGLVTSTLTGAAIAALLVLRLASARLLLIYAGGLLIFTALGAQSDNVAPADITACLIVATLAGGIGLALRLTNTRGRQLEQKIADQAEEQRQAILAERRWIADELHDSIAHHLTIISLHAQLLDDDAMRPTSEEAIQIAARKALTDLRFVINMAEEAPTGVEVPTGDLAAAIDEARKEFEAAGHTTVVTGDPSNEMISRGVDIILAHVVRESATNIIKYAGPGEVHFDLDVARNAITLHLRSPLSTSGPRVNSSTGTGLNRMAERVLGVSGEFSAGPEDGMWVVSVRLPIESANNSGSEHSDSASRA